MARYIDVRRSGDDLIVIGQSLVIPNSATPVDSSVPPFNGAIRFNPTSVQFEVCSNGIWAAVGAALVSSGSFATLTDVPASYQALATVASNGTNAVEYLLPGQVFLQTVTNSRVLLFTDAGYYLRCGSASPMTMTVPSDITAPSPIGTCVTMIQSDVGKVTVVPATGVSLLRDAQRTNSIVAQNGVVQVIKQSPNQWLLSGQLGYLPRITSSAAQTVGDGDRLRLTITSATPSTYTITGPDASLVEKVGSEPSSSIQIRLIGDAVTNINTKPSYNFTITPSDTSGNVGTAFQQTITVVTLPFRLGFRVNMPMVERTSYFNGDPGPYFYFRYLWDLVATSDTVGGRWQCSGEYSQGGSAAQGFFNVVQPHLVTGTAGAVVNGTFTKDANGFEVRISSSTALVLRPSGYNLLLSCFGDVPTYTGYQLTPVNLDGSALHTPPYYWAIYDRGSGIIDAYGPTLQTGGTQHPGEYGIFPLPL